MDKIERAISKVLEPKLAEYGFKLIKKRHKFVRFTDYGFDEFMVINKGRVEVGFLGIECGPGIRHDKIQSIYSSLDSTVYGNDSNKEFSTLVMRYPFYSWGKPFEYMKLYSASADDIANMAEDISRVFSEHARPFYQRFSQLSEVEELLNKEPMADISPYSGGFFPEHRVAISLLCAKAVNPARYDLVKEAFVKKDQGAWSREKRMEILRKIDEMQV